MRRRTIKTQKEMVRSKRCHGTNSVTSWAIIVGLHGEMRLIDFREQRDRD